MLQPTANVEGPRLSCCTARTWLSPHPAMSTATPWLASGWRYRVHVKSRPVPAASPNTNSKQAGTAQISDMPEAGSTKLQWDRFIGFVEAGDPKEAWLSISSSTLRMTVPAALLGLFLHSTVWGGSPPQLVVVAEAAAWVGAVAAGSTEVWKVLEGFQG